MMTILTSNKDIDRAAWSALVHSSPTGTWFQTPEAYDFFASLPQEMQPFVVGVADDNKLCGVVVGYVTQDSNALKQFFTRRAIIIGGPLLDDNISDTALEQLLLALRKCLKQHAIYIEMRNFNDYSPWRKGFESAGFAYEEHLNFHVHTNRHWDEIESYIGKHRRKYIRLSFRDGASVVETPTKNQVKEFYNVLRELYRTKVKMPLQPWEFFERLYKTESCKFLLVEYEGNIVGGSVCMVLSGTGAYEWFASAKDG